MVVEKEKQVKGEVEPTVSICAPANILADAAHISAQSRIETIDLGIKVKKREIEYMSGDAAARIMAKYEEEQKATSE